MKCVLTESIPGYHDIWPDPYIPEIKEYKDWNIYDNDKFMTTYTTRTIKVGQKVGRDESIKAEQTFVKLMSQMDDKEEIFKLRREWEKNKLNNNIHGQNDNNPHNIGPTVLPFRAEDVAELPGAELAGFMPRRGDFDIEYNNEIEESTLADMEFLPTDLPSDRNVKLQVLQIYNDALNEREKKKQFILSRKLYDYKKSVHVENNYIDTTTTTTSADAATTTSANQTGVVGGGKDTKNPFSSISKDERDLIKRMRLFERFHTPEEHKIFIRDILKAKRLRKSIAKLQTYRRIGIRTLAEAERYELDKSSRQFHKMEQLSSSGTTNPLQPPKPDTDSTNDPQSYYDESSSLWKQYSNSSSKRRSGRRMSDSTATVTTPGQQKTKTSTEAPTTTTTPMPTTTTSSAKTDPSATDVSGEQKETKVEKEFFNIDDIKKCRGFRLLTSKEIILCEKLQLLPRQYLEVKKALIHEALTNNLLDSNSRNSVGNNNNNTLMKMDVQKRGNIIDFMIRAGWISSTASAMANTSVSNSNN